MQEMGQDHIILPRSHESGEVGRLIEVDPVIGLQDEPGLIAKGPDDAGALHRFIEVGVDG